MPLDIDVNMQFSQICQKKWEVRIYTDTQRERAQVATGLRAPLPAPSLMGQAGSGGVRPDCWSKLDLGGVSWRQGSHCRPQLAALFEGPVGPPPFVVLY